MVSNIIKDKTLDVCSGTGDISSRLQRKGFDTIACDFSIEMLRGQSKINIHNAIAADATQLPFKNNTFSCITIAFGIRNINNIETFLNEANRVLQKKGHLAILELTMPDNFIIRKLYSLYLSLVVGGLGGLLSGNFYAYKYLSSTIKKFMTPDKLSQIMKNNGFEKIEIYKLTFGTATIILGKKR